MTQYYYDFDLQVMHPMMLRSFAPFFVPGNLLELGSYQGDFTMRLMHLFSDITCVDMSAEAMESAREKLGGSVTSVNSPLETAELPRKYDNILLVHVLEHLDDPVFILKRIRDEWLADDGRLFVACPNANAPSRQIAVEMGLLPKVTAVMEGEAKHGHKRTYTLDTLEQDIRSAGLKTIHCSGIFFKALANFQWDRLLGTDIITPEYLEGCYRLGMQYPELCSTIFWVCKK